MRCHNHKKDKLSIAEFQNLHGLNKKNVHDTQIPLWFSEPWATLKVKKSTPLVIFPVYFFP
jgi:hypothetical protein